jgi:secreted trypsin-like serine protease
MRRLIGLVLACSVLLAGTAAPAAAVTYGTPDTEHDYVGLLVFYDAEGTPLWRCTGTLISPTVVLTAGHCTYGADSAQFFLQDTMPSTYPYSGGITGDPYTYPLYDDAAFYTNDVGVVVLDKRVTLREVSDYGELPDVGTVEDLLAEPSQLLTIVGYGLQGVVKPVASAERTRYQGTVMLIEATSSLAGTYSFRFTATPAQSHSGGGCFGDSGGPVFIEGTNIILGVTSYVMNLNCKGTGGAFRIDQEPVLDWINSFL